MDWQAGAVGLAEQVTGPESRWRTPVATTRRDVFVPAWWRRDGEVWRLHTADVEPDAVYTDDSLVTRVGPVHADHAEPDQTVTGRATSSSTQPALLVKMFRHAHIGDQHTVLEVGTGSGYGCALLCARLTDRQVTSIDIDDYLVQAAGARLAAVGYSPHLVCTDATAAVDGIYDRVVATVGLRPIPPALVAAVAPGGRLVAVVSGIRAVLTADRLDDGRLFGRIEHATGAFMPARHGDDCDPAVPQPALDEHGESVGPGLYPLANPDDHWELASMLGVTHPHVEMRWSSPDSDGVASCLLWDTDGSWARAEGAPGKIPLVHQSGPQRLWTQLDELKTQWLIEGGFPLYGAAALVDLDGSVDLLRGTWRRKIT